MKTQHVCIIGYGYVGSAIVDYLKNDTKYTITCVTRNKPDKEVNGMEMIVSSYERLTKEFYSQFDTIVLTAGQSSPVSSQNLIEVVYNDILSFAYLVEILDDSQKLVYMSSAALYGDTENREANENDSVCVQNYYDLGKQVRDYICLLNSTSIDNKHKQIYGLRIGTLAGTAPITRTDLIINKMVKDAQTLNTIHVGKNNINRSIIGVKDLCRVIETIIKSNDKTKADVYNICSFNSDVLSIAKKIQEHFPSAIVSEVNSHAVNTPYDFKMNNTMFCKAFDFTFDDNLDNIITDVRDNLHLMEESVIRPPKKHFELTDKCRVCKHQTTELLNLGYQPLANNYHTGSEHVNWYPLCLHYCPNCFHVQLTCTVDPEVLFKNYLYVSGTSNTGKQYFYDFAKRTVQRVKLNRCLIHPHNKLRVLDIACNDGSQLDAFKKVCEEEGIDVLTVGVDPAKNLYDIASSKGHTIHCEFFDDNLGATLKSIHGEFDVIIAQNVFAHVDSPGKFLEGCVKLMHDNSLIYIQTSQAKMIENGEWDTAYHEHLSFFNSNSMNVLCKKYGVSLNRVDLTPIHGTSYVFEITKKSTDDSNTVDVIYEELEKALYTEDTYTAYTLKCQMYKNQFHNQLLKYKLEGYNIIAFGSTAKFNTVLNSIPIDNTLIDYIIDENPLKQGLLTPGSNIPVVPVSLLSTINSKTIIIVSAWNFYKEIREKLETTLKNYGISNNIKLLNINPLQEEDARL